MTSKTYADPSYPLEHGGSVLVCGYGMGLLDDVERAKKLRGDLPIIAVNRATRLVKAFAIFTLHPDQMGDLFVPEQVKAFGSGHFTTHTGKLSFDASKFPAIDYWWRKSASAGSSSWSAAKMALLMGFEEVILCGAPLSIGNYEGNLWSPTFQRTEVVELYRNFVENDTKFHPYVRSMSGWTRELLGEPK